MTYILGVDGGNTKTIALVACMDSTIVGARPMAGCGTAAFGWSRWARVSWVVG